MNPVASRSFCPRLSEACVLLPLVRGHLVAAAPRSLAATLELVPIVEDGLFGYELVPDRETHTYPIIGCNAQGEPVLRTNTYGVGEPGDLRLVAVNGRLLSRSRRAERHSLQRSDALFPNWPAAAESAWARLLPLFPDRPRQDPVLRESAHRWLDKALLVARSHLDQWNPFIEFFGLPNEAHLGFALSGAGGERGELTFQQPCTWSLRWNTPTAVVCESWNVPLEDSGAGNEGMDGDLRSPDRRARCRRARDRGRFPDSWPGQERRKGRGRRAVDLHTW